MPKKTSSSVLEKFSSFVKLPLSLANMRNPITLNLIFLKKKSGKFKKSKFLRHYNYGYIQEYQFSPSSTPLINSKVRKSKKSLNSMLFMCLCLGNIGEREEVYSSMETLPPIINGFMNYGDGGGGEEEEEEVEMLEIGGGEYGLMSVDERAERFIEKFYAQMRMQGKESSSNAVSLLLGD